MPMQTAVCVLLNMSGLFDVVGWRVGEGGCGVVWGGG